MKKVLLVGNCDLDGPMIKTMIEVSFKVKVYDIKTIEGGIRALRKKSYDLIIINRVGAFDNGDGIELIDYVKSNKIKAPIMLITNLKGKMKEAIRHGAVQGFGKSELGVKAVGVIGKYLS